MLQARTGLDPVRGAVFTRHFAAAQDQWIGESSLAVVQEPECKAGVESRSPGIGVECYTGLHIKESPLYGWYCKFSSVTDHSHC